MRRIAPCEGDQGARQGVSKSLIKRCLCVRPAELPGKRRHGKGIAVWEVGWVCQGGSVSFPEIRQRAVIVLLSLLAGMAAMSFSSTAMAQGELARKAKTKVAPA